MSNTVLDLVQDILSAMDSDNVNSINDTIESTQVAKVIKQQYDQIVERFDLPSSKTLFSLSATSDATNPTNLKLPDNTVSVEWLTYNTADTGQAIKNTPMLYLLPGDFISYCNGRVSTSSNIVTNTKGVLLRNDLAPTYYTSFDDSIITLDSWKTTVDGSYLSSSKSQAYGEQKNTLNLTDSTVVSLPDQLITLLRNEAMEMCFNLWKEGAPNRLTQDAARTRVRAQRIKDKLRIEQESLTNTGPDYGRKPWRTR